MKSARPRILRKITAAMLRNSSKVGYVVQRKYQAELLPALMSLHLICSRGGVGMVCMGYWYAGRHEELEVQ